MGTPTTFPVSSFLGGVQFGRMPDDEVKRLSVKRIHVTPTLDSMNGPMPGGVHDLALGAISALDATCSTCRLGFQHCPGHCGHIELPTQVYHPQYMDTTLRLLRAKCIYCHEFRIPLNTIHYTICQLRLLQRGLVNEYLDLARYKNGSKRRKQGGNAMEVDDAEEDPSDLMDRRDHFVSRSIRKAKKRGDTPSTSLQDSVAVQARKDVIVNFLQLVALQKKCTKCQGITPAYRKDRTTKIFRKPLPPRSKELMKSMDKHAPNPLLFLIEERKAREPPTEKPEKPVMNGHADQDEEMSDMDVDVDDHTHGAEEEIATRNAMDAQSSSKLAELEGEAEAQAYMTPAEVHAALTLLFEREQEIVDLLFAPLPGRKHVKVSADMFFISNILVPPNKFRPLARQGPDAMLESAMNGPLNKVINASNDLKVMMREHARTSDVNVRRSTQTRLLTTGVALQEMVNALIDSPVGPTNRGTEQGIKQVLEKKEGLFRMNMMGKRVNYAARSVISPDPNIETNEIGVPLVFAKKLTYPEPVTRYNYEVLSRAVINGFDEYPGAAAIENELGQVMSLRRKTKDQRRALAKQLMTSTVPGVKGEIPKKVYRHLQTGDVVLMNRQPTLHKPSMMGHRARVLKNEKTIRMHYANCNTYNADFDGDEMNMHFPQNELARAEALQIADTDHQYLSATAGKPLRGLIQDHISMAVQFTSRDTFYTKEQYHELLYNCLRPEDYNAVHDRILTLPPAVIKPQKLWTGKQIISTVMMNIVPDASNGINLTGKSQTSADYWGEKTVKSAKEIKVTPTLVQHRETEQTVIFRNGEHLCGILDKGQIGPANGGLIHSVHELYGHSAAGKLLSILGRLLTRVLNERAWSCGMEDLYLTKDGDAMRVQELGKTAKVGHDASVEYVNLDPKTTTQGSKSLVRKLEDVLRNDEQLNTLDQLYKTSVKTITDAVGKVMPNGLIKPFPLNQMQAMTVSGAKGSGVNAALISCVLGQQVLEGRRVPTMVSGKTLPLFRAFETHPVAGGYVMGRFLTGIRPAEYYFHAMSGREGLIDTAVKTAKSGYLQRCIIKGLEGLKTEYDTSVREVSNGSVVQFLYGEDGLEVTKQKHLKEFTFLAENNKTVTAMMRAEEAVREFMNNGLDDMQKNVLKAVKKGKDVDPMLTLYPPANNFGSVSESFSNALNTYCKNNPDKLLKDKKANVEGLIGKKTFQSVLELKYMRSVVDAGEAVGVVAAQSVGEPSTQMTLNTFHLAGHSAKNVTLGIPRLREIIMTATSKPTTPTMTLRTDVPAAAAEKFAKSISKLALSDVLKDMSVTESSKGAEKLYDIKMSFYPPEEYCEEYNIQVADVARSIQTRFLPLLHKTMKTELKKKAKEATLTLFNASVPQIGVSVGQVEQERTHTTRTAEREGGEDDIDEDADMDDAKDASGRARRNDDFDEPDDDEARLADQDSQAGDDDEEDEQSKRLADQNSQTLKEQNPDDSDNDSDDDSGIDMTTDADPDSDDEAKLNILVQKVPHLKTYRFSRAQGKSCHLTLSYDSETPKLLLLPILEKCARTAVIQNIPGLDMCTMYMEDVLDPHTSKPATRINPDTKQEETIQEPVITTQGVNLIAIRELQDIVNPHSIYTNSVHDMLKHYGVEAARATIAKEISAVFGGHGISVDNRHISLIADAMTQSGGYKAFSRHGLVQESGSILAKMSFETVMGFLKDAVLFGEVDELRGPSARIVAGRRSGVGTGSFDVVQPV